MLRSICGLVLGAGLVLGLCGVARAQSEPIFSPVPAPPGELTLFYHNVLPPNPDRKILTFHGGAESNGFPAITHLFGNFDWLNTAGGTDVSPVETFTLLPSITNPVDMSFVVPFCPSEVSIHFRTDSPAGAFVSGTFEHRCLPIPEPGSIALLGLATAALAMRTRWDRARA